MQTDNSAAVVERLRSLHYTIVSVKPTRGLASFKFELPSLTSISAEQYVMYTAQLSSMLSAGFPLSTSLETMAEQTENSALRDATVVVSQDVRAGASFSEALRKQPRIFPNLFVNMVAAGEVAGNLEEVLERLSAFMEKSAEFKQKIMTAIFYPIILIVFGTLVVIFIILSVLPTFVKMFTDSGVPLPLPTQVLYNINLVIRGYWQVMLLALASFVVSFNIASKTKTGKAFIDRAVLEAPVTGPLSRKINVARFSRSLSSLLNAGVPILKSLETMEQTTDNAVFRDIAKKCYSYISKGGTLAEQLKASREFPAMPTRMVAVGEESGKLAQMLSKVADFYEMSVDYSVKRLTSILEPILLVVVGGMVGFIFASVLLPIFQMIKTIR